MKNSIKLIAIVSLFSVACSSVKKTSHEEKTSEKIIANTSRNISSNSVADSTASSESIYDYSEKTTIELPAVLPPGFNLDAVLKSIDSCDVPANMPAGTRIIKEKKGRTQTRDTVAVHRTAALNDTSSATGEIEKSFHLNDNSKKSWRPSLSIVIGAVVVIVILIILFLLEKRFTRKPL